MARLGFPVVLSAPSGTGKTTLSHLLVNSVANLQISVSYTTRPIRGNERDGIDYNFISDEGFQKIIDDNKFLEWADVHGYRYGSGLDVTQKGLDEGLDVVFDIDVQGGLQIKKRLPNAVLIFILPPSLEALEERLTKRGTDSQDRIKRRMKASRDEIVIGLKNYDYVINNEKLDRALFDLTAIVRTHRLQGINREKIKNRLLG
ncbi:guanylate kinase [Sulfobacillus acidophilus]|uniref:Guanylate kinase n=1 Tax=Sulfobacillus acidophilus TaxID=53633 RepID=A0ABS3AV83_9FIRM|nr:guanylate kinase [Sulfobacillus acidophilus]